MPPAPVNYIPPKNLFKHKIANPSSLMQHIKTQEANQSIKQPHAMSKLDPRMGRDSKWTTLLGLVEGNTNEQKIDRNVPPSTSSISKYTTREPPPPPLVAPAPFPSAPLPHSDTLSPADFRVLDSIATLARGKDASATLQTPIPSIPSLSSIAKLTALPPPVMFASEILGASPTSKQQKKNPPQKVSKKQVDKVSPKSETKRKKRSTKASPVPTTSVSDEQQRQSLMNQEISFLQVEEKSDTLDWGVTSWGVWGQKQFPPEAGTSITTNTDFFPTTTLQILPDDSYDYSNSNPSILRKRISKKRKQPSSSSNQNDMESLSTNSSPHDHGIPTESYHSGIGMDLPHLGDFSNQDNSMLMPIFDEFSMM